MSRYQTLMPMTATIELTVNVSSGSCDEAHDTMVELLETYLLPDSDQLAAINDELYKEHGLPGIESVAVSDYRIDTDDDYQGADHD